MSRRRGSIREKVSKRTGQTHYELRAEFPPDPFTHRRRSFSRTVRGGTRKEAEKILTTWLAEIDRHQAVIPDRILLPDLLQRWLEDEAKPRVGPGSFADYESTLRNHIAPYFTGTRAQTLRPSDVHAWLAQLSRRGVPPPTQHIALVRLKQVLKWATAIELVHRNVAESVRPPEARAREKRPLTYAEAQAFLAAAEQDRLWPLWLVYLATGLRRGEGMGLQWRDVDLERHRLAVRRAVTLVKQPDGRSIPVAADVKTATSRRVVTIDTRLAFALAEHQEQRLPDCEWVFPTRIGTLLSPGQIGYAFERLRDQAGLDPAITLHEFRHTHASHALAAGMPLLELSRRLGHSNPAVTMRVYAHLLPDAASSIDDITQGLYRVEPPALEA